MKFDLRRAVASAITGHKWERSDDGSLYLQRERATISGQYTVSDKHGVLVKKNILPIEGLIAMLNIMRGHLAVPSAMYIALNATALTPLSTHTGATGPAAFGEITSGTEGYTEATRVSWVTVTASGTALIHNNASPAVFTIATASTIVANSIAMYTTSTKGDTTGKLISATRFPAARTYSDTDEIDIKYQLGLSS
jgi:hypothetical protein